MTDHLARLCMDGIGSTGRYTPYAFDLRLLGTEQAADHIVYLHEVHHAALVEEYKKSFIALRSAGEVEEPLYEGIAEVLDTLEEDGWQLAVATGKSDRGLRHCLESHGIAGRFVSLQTADRHPSKPDPSMALQAIAEAGASPDTSVVIGDTSFDMLMAANAGARAIGVDWGYHHRDELLEAGAASVAAHPLELLEHLRGRGDE